jgi:hypothetical protein
LAQLKRGGAPPAPAGNRYAWKSGAYARISDERLAEIARMRDALGEDAPLLDAGDAVALWDWAALRVQIQRAELDIEAHGWKSRETGEARQLVRDLATWRRQSLDYAREFGGTPRARVALGLDLARGQALDLTQVLSSLDDDLEGDDEGSSDG